MVILGVGRGNNQEATLYKQEAMKIKLNRVWVTAAIGMAAGMGRESTAALSTLIALLVLSLVPLIFRTKKDTKE
jgi:hypothetical protein